MSDGVDFDVIEAALINFAQEVTGKVCIWGEENAPQPALPYCKVSWLVMPHRVGEDDLFSDVDTVNKVLVQTLAGYRKATIAFHVFSDSNKSKESATYFAGKLNTHLGTATMREKYFDTKGIGIGSIGGMQNVPFVRDGTKWIGHVVFEVDLNLVSNVKGAEQPGYLTEVLVTGTIDAKNRGTLDIKE